MLPPRSHPGHRSQVNELNRQVRVYNCTSDYLSAGKNYFRDRLATLTPGKLKDLVVRASEARLPVRYMPAVHRAPAIGPVLPGQQSAKEELTRQFQELVTTWSEHATQLDGPIRETREYLAELEKEMLRSLDIPSPHCPP